MNKFILSFLVMTTTVILSACSSSEQKSEDEISPETPIAQEESGDISATVCTSGTDLSLIPENYLIALEKYALTNSEYSVYVCTEDANNDGEADYMVIESTNLPEHESVYFDESNHHHKDFDFTTNQHKYDSVYNGTQRLGSAGNNKIEAQSIIMKMPINPTSANTKTATSFATIGLALNGVSFFNENAAPGDEITEELFTFDQCSGHPQQQGVYHYHVDPVCLIRDLGGNVNSETITVDNKTYQWLEDDGSNGSLLLGFLKDGFPVYGPVGNDEKDCSGINIDTSTIDQYNGHSHCTAEFDSAIYHYHVKTAELGGTGSPVFWITNEYFYGIPGIIQQ